MDQSITIDWTVKLARREKTGVCKGKMDLLSSVDTKAETAEFEVPLYE